MKYIPKYQNPSNQLIKLPQFPIYKTQQEADAALNQKDYDPRTGDRETYFQGTLTGPTISAANTPVGYRADEKSMREDLLNTSPILHYKVPRKYDKYKVKDRLSTGAPAVNPSTQGLIKGAQFIAQEAPMVIAPLPFVEPVMKGLKFLGGKTLKGLNLLEDIAEKGVDKIIDAPKHIYKLNPRAIKINPDTFLYRARPTNQDITKNMAAQLQEKKLNGETLKWYQENMLNTQTDPAIIAREKYYGRWFENDPSRLDFYIDPGTRNFADNAQIEILRTKLPKSEALKLNVSKFDDAKILSSSPKTEFILPVDLIKNSERFPSTSLQQLIQEDKAFNTPHWLKGYNKTPKSQTNFKSKINWAEWNKEIPENIPLMKEYNAIEQTSKANGTWMKNPDGSTFVGTNPTKEELLKHGIDMTPEQAIQAQFIQQNSKNIPKNVIRNANGSIQGNYHASKSSDITEFKEEYFNQGAGRGLFGKGNYTTKDKNYAQQYLGLSKGGETVSKDKLYSLYINSKNPTSARADNLFRDYGQGTKDIFKNINDIPTRQQLAEKYKLIGNTDEKIDRMLEMFYNETPREIKKIPFKENDYLEILGMKSGQEQITPFNNYLKSAIGNNGMFDMTNPNIYKSILGIIGLGGATNYSLKTK